MRKPKVGFIVYGVHKDGLKDPMGQPFIDDSVVRKARESLASVGLNVVRHDIVIASKPEAMQCLSRFKKTA